MNADYLETNFNATGPRGALRGEFAIITAYATTGEKWNDEQNDAADRLLESTLAQCGAIKVIAIDVPDSSSSGSEEIRRSKVPP